MCVLKLWYRGLTLKRESDQNFLLLPSEQHESSSPSELSRIKCIRPKNQMSFRVSLPMRSLSFRLVLLSPSMGMRNGCIKKMYKGRMNLRTVNTSNVDCMNKGLITHASSKYVIYQLVIHPYGDTSIILSFARIHVCSALNQIIMNKIF